MQHLLLNLGDLKERETPLAEQEPVMRGWLLRRNADKWVLSAFPCVWAGESHLGWGEGATWDREFAALPRGKLMNSKGCLKLLAPPKTHSCCSPWLCGFSSPLWGILPMVKQSFKIFIYILTTKAEESAFGVKSSNDPTVRLSEVMNDPHLTVEKGDQLRK